MKLSRLFCGDQLAQLMAAISPLGSACRMTLLIASIVAATFRADAPLVTRGAAMRATHLLPTIWGLAGVRR